MNRPLRIVGVGAVGAVMAWRVAACYRADINAARQRLATVDRTIVPTGFGDLEYAEEGSGEPLLVIHGIFGGCDAGLLSYGGLLPDRRVIAPSRFGYLGSAIPPGATPAMQADAYVELLDRLAIETVDVIGYSAGSTSSIQLALRHPDRVRHLVIMCGDLPGPTAVHPAAITKVVFRSDVAMWLAKLVARPALMRFIGGLPKNVDPSPPEREIVLRMLDSIFPVRQRSAGVLFDGFVSNPAVNAYPLEDITVPTLLVHARDDNLASYTAAQTAANRIPGSRLVTLARGGHLMLGQQATIRDAVSTFLQQASNDRTALQRRRKRAETSATACRASSTRMHSSSAPRPTVRRRCTRTPSRRRCVVGRSPRSDPRRPQRAPRAVPRDDHRGAAPSPRVTVTISPPCTAGNRHDGAAGATALRHLGRIVAVSDEATSALLRMPDAAIARGAVDAVLPLPRIASFLGWHVRGDRVTAVRGLGADGE